MLSWNNLITKVKVTLNRRRAHVFFRFRNDNKKNVIEWYKKAQIREEMSLKDKLKTLMETTILVQLAV